MLPLFSFSPDTAHERPDGHGTEFRIDPWSGCATAFHVLEDLFEVNGAGSEIVLKQHVRLAALELDGLGYGLNPIPDRAMEAGRRFVQLLPDRTAPIWDGAAAESDRVDGDHRGRQGRVRPR